MVLGMTDEIDLHVEFVVPGMKNYKKYNDLAMLQFWKSCVI